MPPDDPHPSVHLLIVHGVGRQDRLTNLLRTYQTIRSNLTSDEAPVAVEDQIPGWRLTRFEEEASPPFLTLEPRVEPQLGSVGAVNLYEVNYSDFAGIIRDNQPLDLTTLFVGLDLAVCAARQRTGPTLASPFGGGTAALGRCMQAVSGILAAGTVPIIGLPSILFREYIGTFVAIFARFFEDVATFAIDKNGEQLISTHLDRTAAAIASAMRPGDRFVLAAHSLGSVVVHNFIVRQRSTAPQRVPDAVITFGSPIGLLTWAWLFLDFQDMNFKAQIAGGDHYFSWNPVSRAAGAQKKLSWINVVNCMDPIATAFPDAAVDLSAGPQEIANGLEGGAIAHRFFGPAKVSAIGRAHTEYFNDKNGFVAILLRSVGLAAGAPDAVPQARSAKDHWTATEKVLRVAQVISFAIALASIAAYCAIVAWRFHDARALMVLPLFAWPPLTIGVLAFFQRLLRGGPTKRIATALIAELRWRDLASFPYRLRKAVAGLLGLDRDVDPMAPSPGGLARLLLNTMSFLPTLGAMAIPIVLVAYLNNRWPTAADAWARLWTVETLAAVALFMLHVVGCAVHEMISNWRRVVRIVTFSPNAHL